MSAPTLKLSYFDCRGRAELTRTVLAYGQIAFEDDRVKRADFTKLKESGALPFGQFPVLYVDGTPNSQSYAIARYAASLCGLIPEKAEDQLRSDQIMLTTEDVRSKLIPIRYSGVPDADRLEKYNNFYQNLLPGLLKMLAALLGDADYFVGGKISLADICIFNMCGYLTFPACKVVAGDAAAKEQAATCLKSEPTLEAHFARIAAEPGIKAWLENRPAAEHDNVLEMADK